MEFQIQMDILNMARALYGNYKEEILLSLLEERKWKHCALGTLTARFRKKREAVRISLVLSCSSSGVAGGLPLSRVLLLLVLSSQIKSKSFWHWVEYWNNSSQRMISSLISYIGLEFTICWESKHQRLWNLNDLHSLEQSVGKAGRMKY